MTFEELNKKIENAGKAISSLPENRRGQHNGAYFYGVGGQDTAHAQPDLNSSVSGSSAKLITEMGLDPGKYEIGVLRGGRAYNVPKAIEDAKLNARFLGIEEKISNDKLAQQEAKYNTLSQQIQSIIGGGGQSTNQGFNQALTQLSADRNYGSSDLGTMLNFQVSDQQIIDDYNNSKLSRLNSVIDRGNAQIAGINERLSAANKLLADLPANSAQRTSSEVFIKQLNDDLKSVTSAVTSAQDMQKNFTPITMDSPEGLKEITSFRSYAQLPEERAAQQLYQIDPESYRTAVGLGQQYRRMATEPIGPTTTPETEQLRQTIEDEALNQLRLGSTIGAEERRGYEQSIRAAQTARGNIFGLGPAVQEAAQIGAAGEQRKLARYGAAQSFLGSGLSSGDALKADIAFRDALRQNRLGAAANFIGGGPSIYNLAGQRTAQQQGAMQSYIQANQPLPGGFNQQPSTAANFYQTTSPEIPVALQNAFANLYGSQANYLSSTYGAQVGAISRQPSGAEQFGQIATGLGNLIKI
ncbi:MAG: hypothetical protein EBT07_10500 [Actinobacteria bacterium]|nr:hypothetical protein [Actinomycetota bacterium]